MKLLLALMLVSGLANAQQWERVDGNQHATVYLDTASIRPQGRYIEAYSLISYPSVRDGSTFTFKSQKNLDLYDCASHRISTQAMQFFSDSKGKKLVNSAIVEGSNREFRDPIPGSLVDNVMRRICRST